jgi:hypothetical protein
VRTNRWLHILLLVLVCDASAASSAEVLVEAEGFSHSGGWLLDPQFLDVMGSPYLIAHGLGKPVANAATDVDFPQAGRYRLWVRTKDWVPTHHPGVFRVIVDGSELAVTFGNQGQRLVLAGRWTGRGQEGPGPNRVTRRDRFRWPLRCPVLHD